MEYRIAIVEDNATARTTLRGHLMPIANLNISSFASGGELKSALRKQNFELIVVDFHLGQDRSGAEWIHSLREAAFLRPSTGIIFLTSDRSPQTIGRIMDLQPDGLIIKPYTIASLTRQIKHYLTFRRFVQPALFAIDNKQLSRGIKILTTSIREGVPSRLASDVRKLYAHLLFENGEIHHALSIYNDILTRSEKVLWAQWGKIKCQYHAGLWSSCESELSDMVESQLSRDHAFEWLASLSFEQESYEEVEYYLNEIKFSELSLPATRLKSIAFQKQDKVVEAIDVLQKKRAMHRSAKNRFNDFTFELAEFYLLLADDAPETNRAESLMQARKLVGLAARNQNDTQVLQKRDYLLAFSAILEGDNDKAAHLLEHDYMDNYFRTAPSILIFAAKVHHQLGDDSKANQLLTLAKQKNADLQAISERVINDEFIFDGGERLGLNHEQALMLNDTGMKLFTEKHYLSALKHFYDAFTLSPDTAAFGINLLQCLIESDTAVYRKYGIKKLIRVLSKMALTDNNKQRLTQLTVSAQAQAETLMPYEEHLLNKKSSATKKPLN